MFAKQIDTFNIELERLKVSFNYRYFTDNCLTSAFLIYIRRKLLAWCRINLSKDLSMLHRCQLFTDKPHPSSLSLSLSRLLTYPFSISAI